MDSKRKNRYRSFSAGIIIALFLPAFITGYAYLHKIEIIHSFEDFHRGENTLGSSNTTSTLSNLKNKWRLKALENALKIETDNTVITSIKEALKDLKTSKN